MTARLLEAGEPCTLLKSFIARQGVILIAGLIFLAWTASAAGQTRGLVTAHCSEGAGRLLSPEGAMPYCMHHSERRFASTRLSG